MDPEIKAVVDKLMTAINTDQDVSAVFNDKSGASDTFNAIVSKITADSVLMDRSIEEMALQTGIAAGALKGTVVDLKDAQDAAKRQKAAAKATSDAQSLIKLGAIITVLGDNIATFIGGGSDPQYGKGAKMGAAAVREGSSAMGTTIGVGGAIATTAAATTTAFAAGALGTGVVATTVNFLAAAVSAVILPFTLVAAAVVGVAGAFKGAYNAARTFEKTLMTKNLENALERASAALNDFVKDRTDVGALGKARSQLGTAGDAAKGLINVDKTPDAMWLNLIDAVTAGGTNNDAGHSGERSQILQKKGLWAI